jgi:hypothetical protein
LIKTRARLIWNKHNPSITTLGKKDDGEESSKQLDYENELQAA